MDKGIRTVTQYGEDKLIAAFFRDQAPGLVVDVGAGDGEEYSNSRELILSGWRGILIEPEPEQFARLAKLYEGNDRVTCIRSAVAANEGEGDLYPAGTGSTLSVAWKDRGIVPYGDPIRVRTARLDTLLAEANCPPVIDFLSIDAEGYDIEILYTMDWDRYRVRLVCIESGAVFPFPVERAGFEYFGRTDGNTFWSNACS